MLFFLQRVNKLTAFCILTMKKIVFPSGLTIIHKKTSSPSVTIEVMVRVGSNYEHEKIRGISHFIEHMLFEGTLRRPTSGIITNEIERLGGEFNAYTSSERTAYFIKVLPKHFDRALDVISDCFCHPLFEQKIIEKEKKVIIKEIHMVTDDPRFYQWIFFQRALFKNHPTKYPTYGTPAAVNGFTRRDVLDFFKKQYTTSNIIITVAGNVQDISKKIAAAFAPLPLSPVQRILDSEHLNTMPKTVIQKRKTLSSYMVLGYKTVPRNRQDSYVLDVIEAILGKGQSGWIFDEIRNKRGLAYEVNVTHDTTTDHGVFAVQVSTDKQKISQVTALIFKEFARLQKVSVQELSDAKGYIEGSYLLDFEDTHELADHYCFWELNGSAQLAAQYIAKIKAVTPQDIARVAAHYLTKNFTRVIIEPK